MSPRTDLIHFFPLTADIHNKLIRVLGVHSNIGSRFSKEHFACYMTFQPLKAELKDNPILKIRVNI